MVDFVATIYADAAAFKAAVDAIDNTATIHTFSFMENSRQKFMLIT